MPLVLGCTSTATYNQSYEGPLVEAVPKLLDGKALIYSPNTEGSYVFRGGPTSFTGGGTTLEISLGEITQIISTRVFSRIFSGGVERSNSISNVSNYRAAINLRAARFSYAFNQLKNIGFAVTPQVDVSIDLILMNSQGVEVYRHTYDSGVVDGDSYVMSGSPSERINRVAHEAITELINRAAMDTYYLLENAGKES